MHVTSVRNCNRVVRLLQWGLALAILWQAARVTVLRSDPPKPYVRATNAPVATPVQVSGSLELGDLEPIWTRPLQQRLVEPPPVRKPKPRPPPPPEPVKLPVLAATFVEGGTSWALLTDKGGVQRVRAAGQRLGEFVIESVRPGAIALKHKGTTYVVKVVDHSQRGAGPRRRR